MKYNLGMDCIGDRSVFIVGDEKAKYLYVSREFFRRF